MNHLFMQQLMGQKCKTNHKGKKEKMENLKFLPRFRRSIVEIYYKPCSRYEKLLQTINPPNWENMTFGT